LEFFFFLLSFFSRPGVFEENRNSLSRFLLLIHSSFKIKSRYAAPEVVAAMASTGDRKLDAKADARAVVAASSAADAWSLGAIAY
jgi:hypothetical protein